MSSAGHVGSGTDCAVAYCRDHLTHSRTLPHGSCAESVSWKVGDVQDAVSCFGRTLKFHSNAIAPHPRVSANDGGAGSRLSARAILPIPTISHAHNTRGANAIPTIGVNTDASTRSTPSATVRSNASAMTGGASIRLQRWMCQHRFSPCPQASTRSARYRRPRLQRWTRGRCKSLCFQPHTIGRRSIAKRGRDRC